MRAYRYGERLAAAARAALDGAAPDADMHLPDVPDADMRLADAAVWLGGPEWAERPLVLALRGHSGAVRAVAGGGGDLHSRIGEGMRERGTIVSGGDDGAVRVWDGDAGRCVRAHGVMHFRILAPSATHGYVDCARARARMARRMRLLHIRMRAACDVCIPVCAPHAAYAYPYARRMRLMHIRMRAACDLCVSVCAPHATCAYPYAQVRAHRAARLGRARGRAVAGRRERRERLRGRLSAPLGGRRCNCGAAAGARACRYAFPYAVARIFRMRDAC